MEGQSHAWVIHLLRSFSLGMSLRLSCTPLAFAFSSGTCDMPVIPHPGTGWKCCHFQALWGGWGSLSRLLQYLRSCSINCWVETLLNRLPKSRNWSGLGINANLFLRSRKSKEAYFLHFYPKLLTFSDQYKRCITLGMQSKWHLFADSYIKWTASYIWKSVTTASKSRHSILLLTRCALYRKHCYMIWNNKISVSSKSFKILQVEHLENWRKWSW